MSFTRAVVVLSFLATACGASQSDVSPPPGAETPTKSAKKAPAKQTETQRLNNYFTRIFMRTVARSPFIQGYLGMKKDNDKWDDISETRAAEDLALAKGDLKALAGFKFDALDAQGKLSYRLFERRLKESIADHKWRFHSYPVNQMFGIHSQVPAFLGNFHKIADLRDARNYIKRLEALKPMFAQVEVNMRLRQDKGIVPPKFVFPMAIDDCRNILKGAPFDKSGKDSAILADLRKKVTALDKADAKTKAELISADEKALVTKVKPAYLSLIAALQKQEKVATSDDGAWKLPDGAAFYERALNKTTTTKMTAEQIHNLGVKEVARIHDEMRGIMKKVKFKGSLQAFFKFMKTDKQFYFPNTEQGRNAYLKGAADIIKKMEAKLDKLFITKPKRGVIVKRVEAYREKSAGMAFYNPPSLFGKRPGIYYVNLYDMKNLSKYEMEALAFHEGIPGHHMQNTIAMEQEGLPIFRRFLGYTAYGEGWGLYSELLGKEMGFYQDPYSDFGRLAMELWRACRLVIDTGIHHKKWTREQAIKYLGTNTPGAERDVRKAVERYIVMPSQATAYKIGMIEILRLRAKAKNTLGSRFDIREFHETVLTNGAVPLTLLEELVDRWISTKQKSIGGR